MKISVIKKLVNIFNCLTLAGKVTHLLSTLVTLKMAEQSSKREAKLRVKLSQS